MLVLGLSGWVRRAMEAVPMPIVMGMVAGVFLRFGLDLVYAIRDDFWIAAPMIVAFLALSASPRLGRVAAAADRRADRRRGGDRRGARQVRPARRGAAALVRPNLYVPVFSWQAMVELVVPLAITVLVVQNGQGIAVLRAAGHPPPINAITVGLRRGLDRHRVRRHGLDLPDRPGERDHLGLGRAAPALHRRHPGRRARARLRPALAGVHRG